MNIEVKPHIESIEIASDTKELIRLRDFFSNFAKFLNISEEMVFHINLAIDEICSNLIKHSYKDDSTKRILVEFEIINNNLLKIRIYDEGEPFNPIKFNTPDLHNHITHPHKGGLGIPLIKLLVNKMTYTILSENPQKNLLEIEFIFN
jgi:anti-sigma regulatory factor (Ser/Thr protein kinase)